MAYTVDEAREDARQWIRGVTVHDGTRGWRLACALMDARMTEFEAALTVILDLAAREQPHARIAGEAAAALAGLPVKR